MKYLKDAFISLKLLRDNLKVLVPDLSFFVLMSILTFLLTQFLGINITDLMKTLFIEKTLNITGISEYSFMRTSMSLASFFIVTFVAGAAVMAWKYLMIRKIVLRKKVSLWESWNNRSHYIWRVIMLRAFIYALGLSVLAIGAMLVYFVRWVSGASAFIPTTISGILVGVVIVLYRLSVLFTFPALFLKDKNPFRAMCDSWRHFLSNKSATFQAWLIIVGTGILYGLIVSPLSVSIRSMSNIKIGGLLFYVMPIIIASIIYSIKLTYELWSEIFLFRVYSGKNIKQKPS